MDKINNANQTGKNQWTKKNMEETFPPVKIDEKNFILRTLGAEDVELLAEYFLSLSEQTRKLYGPHHFDRETAIAICASIDTDDMIRFIAVVKEDGREMITAYFIVKLGVWESDMERYAAIGMPLDNEIDCMLAPSVSDSCQSSGVGSIMMRYIMEHIPATRRRRMALWGGVAACNVRAVHFYEKYGFVRVNEFILCEEMNYDMILILI